jgi:hypothetical protein
VTAARKLDNVSKARDERSAAGRSAEIILLDTHRPSHADNAIGCECAIPDQALDHIGADMTPEAAAKARAERHRRQRVELRRRMFAHVLQQHQPTGFWERLGHEIAVRVGFITIVGVLVARWKGWI